ncbi:MAG: 2-amino-4-hydroxy-6-hydroxymethyldihydropteridine diphosphokinase [Candidatus Omnitrophica bacterium]|nr:2-amino-4-hydroxy-6-hydroxymethyldihydropteridine diphosphokinase [Candidatus Omnitrophota bacterium]
MAIAFIGLGSNLGDRPRNLASAIDRLRRLPDTKVVQASGWIKTAPIGGPPQPVFLNGVVQLETGLSPRILFESLQQIERAMGRPHPHPRWGPRVIDLDLLAYGDLILEEPDLVIPHPRMHERPFVLIPLAEIAPAWIHPKLGKRIQALPDRVASCESSGAPTS